MGASIPKDRNIMISTSLLYPKKECFGNVPKKSQLIYHTSGRKAVDFFMPSKLFSCFPLIQACFFIRVTCALVFS